MTDLAPKGQGRHLPFVWKLHRWRDDATNFRHWLALRWRCLKWGHDFDQIGSCRRCGGYYGGSP